MDYAVRAEDPSILVGNSKPSSYAAACLAHFIAGGDRVVLKALGRRISTAVDVSQMLVNRLPQLRVGRVEIGDFEKTLEDGRKLRISGIEITVEKTQPEKQAQAGDMEIVLHQQPSTRPTTKQSKTRTT
ncbi:MAG: hypothetical protein QXD47_08715 [Candidatus Caldarchaeum sp.]